MPHQTHESPSKKRKSHPESVSPVKKRSKKASRTDANSEGEFHVINASLTLSIPPIFTNNPRGGVEEMLDSMVMRYITAFRGVVLSHSDLSFTDKRATIKADCPFLVCNVAFNATVWSPKVGMKLAGKVNLCSPDHVSLLIHKTFNASIPRHHIPAGDWEFQYGPAENDPEFGPEAQAGSESQETSEQEEQESAGRWIHRHTGEKLGGDLGDLEFTVIGLTVANEMLSLQGSIQPDPFSPMHVARMETMRHTEEAETDVDNLERQLEDESDEEAGSDIDTFKLLGHKAAQAVVNDKYKRKLEEPEPTADAPKRAKRKGQKEGGEVSKPKRKKTK
ncbi:DNA-directed RNA polymerase I subunit rpa43 [Leucoagaricus sp. SymC.cos]|nr:DNA-directed RNA polymerase I subunit rpa43 [Leucoagaricus sp. SymC.cos]